MCSVLRICCSVVLKVMGFFAIFTAVIFVLLMVDPVRFLTEEPPARDRVERDTEPVDDDAARFSSGRQSYNFEELYSRGLTAYNAEDWNGTVAYMEEAIQSFRALKTGLVRCRISCKDKSSTHMADAVDPRRSLELVYMDRVFREAVCLQQCKSRNLEGAFSVNEQTWMEFQIRKPYDYMQFAYFKSGNVFDAAVAAYTFILLNPDYEITRNNLAYYRTLGLFNDEDVYDRERVPYKDTFAKAMDAYWAEDWILSVDLLEEALSETYQSYRECCALCEGVYRLDDLSDLYESLTERFSTVLSCKLDCEIDLSHYGNEYIERYVANHYHYLQFAYFNIGETASACRSAHSFMLFYPDDEVMTNNIAYYSSLETLHQTDHTPRKDSEWYHETTSWQRSLLGYYQSSFQQSEELVDEEQMDGTYPIVGDVAPSIIMPPPRSSSSATQRSDAGERERGRGDIGTMSDSGSTETEISSDDHSRLIYDPLLTSRGGSDKYSQKTNPIEGETEDNDHLAKLLSETGVTLLMDEDALNGTERAAVDGIVSTEDCLRLQNLASQGMKIGDGYGSLFPHTKHEEFAGMTVITAAEMAMSDKVDPSEAMLFVDLAERARYFTEQYFNLKTDSLYFSYTHLVCRSAIDPDQVRDDMSHPVHADNCYLTELGECIKKPPAYTWRDYSALLYLNEDFDGGEFIFAFANQTIQARVNPVCGRMVMFSAGGENLHGVLPITRGKRCALAMWFTLQQDHKEQYFYDSKEKILQSVLRFQNSQ